jgi:hypothetical protein
MITVKKSHKLDNVCYDIRGPVLREARRLEEDGHKILKLNIGNPSPFGFDAPEEIVQDMIHNVPESQGYSDSRGLYSGRKAVMQYCQEKNIANVEIDDFKLVKGELTTYRSSALAERGFCRDCGSPLTFRYVELPDISVTIGSLDDPDIISPSKQYGTESTVRCFSDLSSLPGKSTQEAMPAGWLERIEGGGS